MMDFREMLPVYGRILDGMVSARKPSRRYARDTRRDLKQSPDGGALEEALSFFFRLLRPHREQLYVYYR